MKSLLLNNQRLILAFGHCILWLLGVTSCLAVNQPPWSLLGEDPRNLWPADSAIADARHQFERTRELHGEASRERLIAMIRLSEQLRIHSPQDSAESRARALEACSLANIFGRSDSLHVAALFAVHQVLNGYYLHSGEDNDIGGVLDENGRCAGCDSIELGMVNLAVSQEPHTSRSFYLERALDLFHRHDNPDSLHYVYALWIKRRLAYDDVRISEALELSEHLTRLIPYISPTSKRAYPSPGMIRRAYGEDLVEAGQLAEALPILRQSIGETAENPGATSCDHARALQKVAELLSELGDFDEAEEYFLRAITVWEQCAEGFPPYFLVQCMSKLGHEYRIRNQLDQAEQWLTAAERVGIERNLGRGQDVWAYLCEDLGLLHESRGDTLKASQYFDIMMALATSIYQAHGDPRPATFFQSYAGYSYRQGNLPMAILFESISNTLNANGYGARHPVSAQSLMRLAWLRHEKMKSDTSELVRLGLGKHRTNDILHDLDVSANSYNDFYRQTANVLPEYLRPLLADGMRKAASLNVTVRLETKPQDMDPRYVHWRLADLKPFQRLHVPPISPHETWLNDPQYRALLDSIRRIDEYVTRQVIRALRGLTSEHVDLVELVHQRHQYYVQSVRLSEQSWTAPMRQLRDSLDATDYGFHGALRLVAPDSLVHIDFYLYDHQLDFLTAEPRYVAFVFRPSTLNVELVELGSAAIIDALVHAARAECSVTGQLDPLTYRSIAKKLYTKLWVPLQPLIRDHDFVVVAPDAELHHVAFAALFNEQDEFLIENHMFHQVANNDEFGNLQLTPGDFSQSRGVLALGDPDFNLSTDEMVELSSVPAERGARSMLEAVHDTAWTPLPASRVECEQIAEMLESGEPVQLLLSEKATEDMFRRIAPRQRVLYLATHGFTTFDPALEIPLDSNAAHIRIVLKRNPLLTSGLVLAGANHLSATPTSDDGILTADEISHLDLRKTELAVISACESGTGRIVPGEGAIAVRRGFEKAGVATIVSSLWKIDDASTLALMSRFAEHGDLQIPVALRQAMLEELRSRREQKLSDHPYFWAGFVASGQWTTTLRKH